MEEENITKLRYKDIAEYRAMQLERQQRCCALCGEAIDGDPVLDHDHKSGFVRMVLHRGCNALLGKIENNLARNKVNLKRLEGIAQNLIKYITESETELLHPKHKVKKRKGK